ncbi:DUF3857 domain-containing transglutaminase family protein [Pelagicoccus mobilis]|uniref:DUF3857 and transglutaminase domain-containing protein n=1 Tax=Pelagicoccus mobilis TaxID=415221 RepID=A0A934S2X6_9BACT|nr:DUF3857 and transglutaminase domain-containing protein [Pelagicoccus mobilis]MBK1879676.1 DUF3857 and transglutaminase domain-containing protein [Pelagicoccus mobilis]
MNRNHLSRSLFCLLALALSILDLNAYKWDEILPEDLAATECSFDPEAPAEVLYKQIIYDLVDNSSIRDAKTSIRVIKYHLRTKIYDKSALDYARRTRFWYSDYFKASAIHARVIKADGSYIEIDQEDVVTKVDSKTKDRTLKSTTISIPNVEVGDIVEYKYRITLDEGYYLPKDDVKFQEEWPIRKLHLKMKPYIYKGDGFKWTSHRTNKSMSKGKNGFFEITLENQPGYPEEPHQAPDSDAKAWFAFYNVKSLASGDAYWKGEGKRLHKQMLTQTKESKTISAKAAELTKGKASEQEKLEAIYDFCRSEIVSLYHGEADRLTPEQRKEIDSKWTASKVLEKGFGNSKNINTLFCALARSAGIDARLSHCADRSDYSFTKTMEEVDIALPHTIVAVKEESSWKFYNPAAKYIQFGQLDWIHDNVTALVPDKKKLLLVKTQAALPEQNASKTNGKFTLHENGDLSGSIELIANGNQGLRLKYLLDDKSEEDRKKTLRKALKENWPNAKINNIIAQNVTSTSEPLRISCELTLPNYAESVGSRLFFQANVDARYTEPKFPSPTRKTDIFFDYKYLDESYFEIALPEGYTLEAPSAPKPFIVEYLMRYEPKLSLKRKSNTLVYKRLFEFEGNRYLERAYPIIKNAFDDLHTQDQHALTLKMQEVSTSTNKPETGDS